MNVVELWHKDYHKVINHVAQINQKWLQFRKKTFRRAEKIIESNKKRLVKNKSIAFAGELINEYM